jgi:hypothetical protein
MCLGLLPRGGRPGIIEGAARHSDDRKKAQREDHPDIALVGIPEALQHGGVSTSLRSSMPPS